MKFVPFFASIIALFVGAGALFAKLYMPKEKPTTPPEAPKQPPQPVPLPDLPSPYKWDTPDNARHSVRLICDEEKLTFKQKNDMCAVIAAESGFHNTALNNNKNKQGHITSTDFGICQINDYFHIGAGKDFPSVKYVLDNPDEAVRWMARMVKAGRINLWSAFVNKSYLRFL